MSSDDLQKYFPGGGEMGTRMRTLDWSATPLGPPEAWPQTLKVAVRILLTSRYAMWMAWGPELTFFFNDAYKPTLGVKHSWALAATAPQVWAEIWAEVFPRIESVLNGGMATWDEGLLLFLERSGYSEETYHTFSYSPLLEDEGHVAGMLCVVTEETNRIIGERRLAAMQNFATLLAGTQTETEVLNALQMNSAAHAAELPFTLVYLFETDDEVCLVSQTGVPDGHRIAPKTISTDAILPWPMAGVATLTTMLTIDDLAARFGGDIPRGPWNKSPVQAVLVPLAQQGQARPAGVLIAGINPYRPFDESYQSFVGLLAGQLAAALANARAYEEERKRAESLAELDRAKTAFFSNVSHEFRTPLTLLLAPIEDLLAKTAAIASLDRELLEVAHRNALRLQKLVNTLLDFSRIEAGRVEARYESTNLTTFTAELASLFESAIERAGLEFVVDCSELSEFIYVDREMWEKIVLNLLSNALKFTFDGMIELSLRQLEQSVQLRVRDTGTGISEEELEHVFERFHRVEGARGRTHEGTGIGLALVQELVKLHGGTVSVSSTLARGSTFTVTLLTGRSHLPSDRVVDRQISATLSRDRNSFVDEADRWLPDEESADPEQASAGEPSHSDFGNNKPRYRVIIADDNADMRRYIRRLLGGRYEIVEVNDGLQALRLARAERPDLILTDVMMPGLDGFGLLKELRQDPNTESIPVIILSARAGDEARVEGLEAGADDYLVKPFSARELGARVSGTLKLARVRDEAIRRESELRAESRGILESITEAFTAIDADWHFIYVNKAAEQVLGMRRQDLLGNLVWDLFPPVLGTKIEQEFRRAMSERVAVHFEERYEPLKGWFEVNVYPNANGGLSIFFRDISERKLSEVLLTQQNKRLRLLWEAAGILLSTDEPDAMLSGLFTKIHDTLGFDVYFSFIVNEPGTDLRVVSSAGISETAAKSISRLGFEQVVDRKNEINQKPAVAIDIQQTEDEKWQLAKAFGVRCLASNPLVAGDRLLGTLSFVSRTRDQFDADELEFLETISRYVTATYERLRLIGQLRESDRRKDEFLATLAHELRNPMAPIRNGLQLMRVGKSPEIQEQARQMMERQLGQLVRLVDDLLDISRITRNRLELRKARTDLRAVIENAVETARPLIDSSGHSLTIKLPLEPVYLDADLTRLAQVFWNLLNNSAKYTEPGGHIWLTTEQEGQEVVVTVRDTGIGIPRELQPRLFELFSQLDQSLERSQGGLGIGLALVKGLTEKHGGTVSVKSQGRNQGTSFIVRLPLATSEQEQELPRVEPNKNEQAKLRVLVVDDNRDGAASLAMFLSILGNDTRTAHDGLEAVELAEAFRPDAIVLDIGLPRLNGYDACRRIRSEPWGKNMMIVAATGWGQDEDRRRTTEAGFDHHLVKPIEPTVLQELLATLKKK